MTCWGAVNIHELHWKSIPAGRIYSKAEEPEMSANYEWQKHDATERIKNRLGEAESHQKAKLRSDRQKRSLKQLIIRLLRIFRVARFTIDTEKIPNPSKSKAVAE